MEVAEQMGFTCPAVLLQDGKIVSEMTKNERRGYGWLWMANVAVYHERLRMST